MAAVVVAILLVALCPGDLLAWSPGTHIYLGETVLANLSHLPGTIADLIRAFPYDFLYGNIAADTSMAKKYAPVGRHCHAWHVGQEIHDRADSEAVRAFGLGYLAHLAADSIAHNFFVPRQLVVTSSTIAIGHSWWESRFETHLGDQFARTAADLIRMDHGAADAHLDRILSPTIFSVRTSRRLFRGMVGVAETQSWQRAFKLVAEKSKWDLSDAMVEGQMAHAFELVMQTLAGNDAVARRYDPAGEASLSLAKRMRLDVFTNRLSADPIQLAEVADEAFGLPSAPDPEFWPRSGSHRPWSRVAV
ncbi:MAG: zinc dependent phospholipase C family protein [Gemmatimonadales bacterium]